MDRPALPDDGGGREWYKKTAAAMKRDKMR